MRGHARGAVGCGATLEEYDAKLLKRLLGVNGQSRGPSAVLGRRSDGNWRLFAVAEGYGGPAGSPASHGVALSPLTAEKL